MSLLKIGQIHDFLNFECPGSAYAFGPGNYNAAGTLRSCIQLLFGNVQLQNAGNEFLVNCSLYEKLIL